MTVLEHLNDVVADLLAEDQNRVLLGEDVCDGTMLGLSRRCCADDELRRRVVGTPLVPCGSVAHAAGLGLAGRRPIMLLPSAATLIEGMAAVREIAALRWRSGGRCSAPVLFVAPTGPGFGIGGELDEESILARVQGLRLLCLGRSHEAGGLLRAAAEFANDGAPTVLLLPRTLLFEQPERFDDDIDGTFTCRWLREGERATVFAWGAAVQLALDAVEETGLDVGVMEVGRLAPLDTRALVRAAKQTGKIVIAHAGSRSHGIGAELAALFSDDAILHLDAPVLRITGDDGPRSSERELTALPSLTRLSEAIIHVADY